MEEIGGTPQPVLPVQPVVETPAPQTATPAASEAPSVSEAPIAAGADAMPSPMPGTILRILVNSWRYCGGKSTIDDIRSHENGK